MKMLMNSDNREFCDDLKTCTYKSSVLFVEDRHAASIDAAVTPQKLSSHMGIVFAIEN